jgi:hypothetical protein
MQVKFYNSTFQDIGKNNIKLDTDTFKAMLVTSAYTYAATHDKRDDITGEVPATGGYTAGGVTLTGVTYTNDAANQRSIFDFNDPTWANSTITARGMVIYKSRGGAASADELLAFVDFETDESTNNVEFKVQINSIGFFVMRAG